MSAVLKQKSLHRFYSVFPFFFFVLFLSNLLLDNPIARKAQLIKQYRIVFLVFRLFLFPILPVWTDHSNYNFFSLLVVVVLIQCLALNDFFPYIRSFFNFSRNAYYSFFSLTQPGMFSYLYAPKSNWITLSLAVL